MMKVKVNECLVRYKEMCRK